MRKNLIVPIVLLMSALMFGALPAFAQNPVELVGADGFAESCTTDNNIVGLSVRFNVPGEVTVRGQAYTDYYNEVTVIRETQGGGDVVQFTMNAPHLPENSVVQYSVHNGNAANAVYVSVNCTTGEVFLERLLGLDGRLFAGAELPVVIYPKLDVNGNPILDFYTIDEQDRGRRSQRVPHVTLDRLPERPTVNTEIATTPNGLATLYKLTSGEYQVNYLPNEEGTVFVVIFDALSPTRISRADYETVQ